MKLKLLFPSFIAAFVMLTGTAETNAQKPVAPKPATPGTVIITKKKNPSQKITIVIDSNNVTVNGKPASDFKSDDIDIIQPGIDEDNYAMVNAQALQLNAQRLALKDQFTKNLQSNKAFLGVMSEPNEKGAKITEVTENSAAEKAGLKEDDIITKIDTFKINGPDDLYKVVGKHIAGDKISIAYTRNNESKTASATLEKNDDLRVFSWNTPEGNSVFGYGPGSDNLAMNGAPFINKDFNFTINLKPRLGLQVQDTEDENGVKVYGVEDDGPAAKAGIEEEDIITSVNGKSIKSVEDVKAAVKEIKPGDTLKVAYKRNGTAKTTDVKFPKPLKTMNL